MLDYIDALLRAAALYALLGLLVRARWTTDSRAFRLWMLVPLALDCAGNLLLRGRFTQTMSARAWYARDHRVWKWTHQFIDGLFSQGHCMRQAAREAQHGSVWAAWYHDFNTSPRKEGATP